MSTIFKPVYHTSLCVIPPKELWDEINKIRKNHDKAFDRWPPHINILFPFVEAELFLGTLFNADVIEAALAHVDKNQIRAAYNRSDYYEKRKELMSWWSDHIERSSQGSVSILSINKKTLVR